MVSNVTNPILLSNRVLKLNVGFLLHENAGYSRTITFDDLDTIKVDDFIISGLDGSLRLTRTPQGILVQGTLLAQTPVECVRCLTPFDQFYEVELSGLFVLESASQNGKDGSNTPYVISEGGVIDLMPILREEGILAIPMQAVCALDCKGLCAQCGQDLNKGKCDCETEHIDPRWAKLRALLEED